MDKKFEFFPFFTGQRKPLRQEFGFSQGKAGDACPWGRHWVREQEAKEVVNNDQVNGEATKRDDKSMSDFSFKEFFQQAIGHAPYDYQRRLAGRGPEVSVSQKLSI